MRHDPYLFNTINNILQEMDKDELLETCLTFVYNTPDPDLKAIFEANLEEINYFGDE